MTKTTAPNAAALDQVEIFKPGRHVAMSGAVIEFSAADVAAIAASYRPELHEAPHVVGHPTNDGPAYGWVRALGVNGAGRLVVTSSGQVEPQFADMVSAGRFKKRSASFYAPQHPNNPTPGSWYLRHVGWLGAQAPAVKGLADVSLADDADVVEFGDWEDELVAGMFRRLREWFIGQFGADTADKVIPSYEVDALQREAMRTETEDTPTPTAAYAEGAAVPTANTAAADPAAIAAREADLTAREAQLVQREQAQADLARSARRAGFASFCDGLVQQGRLLPAERPRVLALMEGLPEAAEVVEFADGDPAKPVKTGAIEVLQGFLKSLPPRVDFSERAAADRTGAALDTNDAQAIARAAQDFAEAEGKAGRVVSIAEAVAHVTRQAGQA